MALSAILRNEHTLFFKDTLKAFDDFKNKQKKFMNWKFIYWKFIQFTILWDKTQMFKKFPSGKINNTKNELFFLLRAPNYQAFTFNSPFSYKLWSTSFVSLKVGMGFSILDSVSFLLEFIFLLNKKHGLFDFTTS